MTIPAGGSPDKRDGRGRFLYLWSPPLASKLIYSIYAAAAYSSLDIRIRVSRLCLGTEDQQLSRNFPGSPCQIGTVEVLNLVDQATYYKLLAYVVRDNLCGTSPAAEAPNSRMGQLPGSQCPRSGSPAVATLM